MESYLSSGLFDLVTPDGLITELTPIDERTSKATVFISSISQAFCGFQIDKESVDFNIKSSLAQLGLTAIKLELMLDPRRLSAEVKILFQAIDPLGIMLLKLLEVGASVGKLFARDERRRVRTPEYLSRMFGRSDRWGSPLLSLGGMQGSGDLVFEKIEGRTVAYLSLQQGTVEYSPEIIDFLSTFSKGLFTGMPMREMLRLHQHWRPNSPRFLTPGKMLLVRTQPLHIRTVFGRVAEELLPAGYHHTSANILQPDTDASGDIYELYGNSEKEISDIPIEFYTLEPHREHVFFLDRDQLQIYLEDPKHLFKVFATAPFKETHLASVFIVKGTQLENLTSDDWVVRQPRRQDFPGVAHGTRQSLMVDRYLQQQPAYPFLKAIEDELITSQGVLFTRYFPTPLMKSMLLGDQVRRLLKAIYFQYPSFSHGVFFSQEDRALLNDLSKYGILTYWVDENLKRILQFVQKPDRDAGMFVPIESAEAYLRATIFGIYGSNLLEGNLENELMKLFQGILQLKDELDHPLLNKNTTLALVTGGGPGTMAVGNKVAQALNILSCANIVDMRSKDNSVVNEQKQNPYVEAKMTYRLDKLVERQAEFNLDFPIFSVGGIGTDFEYSLEEVRRKTGTTTAHPILLFGPKEHWQRKITSRFQCNLDAGTIAGSEWISNCFYCIGSAEEGLMVYRHFFEGKLPIGKNGPVFKNGFATVSELVQNMQISF